jgi:hypothetical protein
MIKFISSVIEDIHVDRGYTCRFTVALVSWQAHSIPRFSYLFIVFKEVNGKMFEFYLIFAIIVNKHKTMLFMNRLSSYFDKRILLTRPSSWPNWLWPLLIIDLDFNGQIEFCLIFAMIGFHFAICEWTIFILKHNYIKDNDLKKIKLNLTFRLKVKLVNYAKNGHIFVIFYSLNYARPKEHMK